MVEKSVVGEVYLSDVSSRLPYSTSYRNDIKRKTHYHGGSEHYASTCFRYRLKHCWCYLHKQPCREGHYNTYQDKPYHDKPYRHACKGTLWRLKIAQGECVELKLPKRIESHVGNEDYACHHCHNNIIRSGNTPQRHRLIHPYACHNDKQWQCRKISCHRNVEQQTVYHHIPPVAYAIAFAVGHIDQHECSLL